MKEGFDAFKDQIDLTRFARTGLFGLFVYSLVGTTAITRSLGANFQGKRLALAHLIFNMATAIVALVFLAPLRDSVDWVSEVVGIAPDDFAMKLAVFHTIFNVIGLALMLPVLTRLITFPDHPKTRSGSQFCRPCRHGYGRLRCHTAGKTAG